MSGSLYGFVAARGPVSPEEIAAEFLKLRGGDGEARSHVERLVAGDPRFRRDAQGRLLTLDLRSAALREAPYVVFDVETTGSSADGGGITEIGAVRIEDGRVVDRFSTLVNPERPIEPFVARLTGITDAMVAGAPKTAEVIPRFERFTEGTVLVGHNAAFDCAFVAAARGGEPLPNPVLDTLRLARALVPGLRRYRLAALARHLRVRESPNHRALSDAAATAEIFLKLLQMLREAGVRTVGEALEVRGRGSRLPPRKRHLAEGLPSAPGVYYFLDGAGRVLYVGKARDLRRRVRTYFSGGDGRRKIGRLVREVAEVRFRQTETELQALVLEAREIRRLRPPYNTAGREPEARWYLRFDLREEYPVPERVPAGEESEGAVLLGPYRSAGAVDVCIEALGRVFPLRRCAPGDGPCIYGQMGRCAPCTGMDPETYRSAVVREVVELLRGEGGERHLRALAAERDRLASELRFEAASRLRDIISGIERIRLARSVLDGGCVRAAVCPSPEPERVEVFVLNRGRLIAHRSFGAGEEEEMRRLAGRALKAPAGEKGSPADEARIVAAYLRRHYPAVEVIPLLEPGDLPAAARQILGR
ncbi:DEDD exonuclease domain-containing protein [Rubrobacter taiwanensis]|uniref:DEDD exonuclease domain-containing protein n=1 Tax=Rubrobacter taiwanensis TaxID=185139 RepID=A0A4R1BFR7_9ACTN|nr:DEDD exonuclease domain-containing protein [Rubrobacter taiwanensis]TCJ16035.1 DEDD exonuclease domain-containing protein [Rubrobacter taiwanensis]